MLPQVASATTVAEADQSPAVATNDARQDADRGKHNKAADGPDTAASGTLSMQPFFHAGYLVPEVTDDRAQPVGRIVCLA
ncbi:hypothetical protein [Lacisediminimonas profundi]|uniref:hypothetical protein n=1 Tax=Lacisediminimonas profundi TaxID=2603856 RepID=UPI00124BA2E5|nr:hypothetical protein [Lacisediminimonas profundi]